MHVEDNSLVNYVFVLATDLVSQLLNRLLHLLEIRQLLSGQFLEQRVGLVQGWLVDHSDFQGTPRDYTLNYS
jgi:hypothetical protein